MNNQKQVIWTEIALFGDDQLRQRFAWALAQIVTTVPGNIDAYDKTETVSRSLLFHTTLPLDYMYV